MSLVVSRKPIKKPAYGDTLTVPATDRKSIGEALGRIVSGAFIVTTKHKEQSTGFLASWVQQASFDPPMISLAVGESRAIKPLLDAGAPFVVNVISETDQTLVSHFAKGFELKADAFSGVDMTSGTSGCPILNDAIAYIECEFVSKIRSGDHTVYFGKVVAGAAGDTSEKPQVRFRRSGFSY